jgi:transcription-repair coupling factor (superfamily II helicase)
MPVAALAQRVIPRSALVGASCTIKPGDEPDRDALLESLVRMGYSNCPLVEERGSFAVRGGILDIFPPSLPRPVRIEFFGDTVETVRSFDPLNQRSLEPISSLNLLPSRELVLSPAALQDFIPRLKTRADQMDIPADRRRQLVAELQGAGYPAGVEFLQPLFHPDLERFTAYLQNPLLVLVEPDLINQAIQQHQSEIINGAKKAVSEERLHPEPDRLYLTPDELQQVLDPHQQIACRRLAVTGETENSLFQTRSEDNSDLRISMARDHQHLLGPLVERLKQWRGADWHTLVVCHHPSQAERLQELLTPYGISCALSEREPFGTEAPHNNTDLLLTIGDLSRGFRLPDSKLAVIAEEELFGKRTRRKSGVTALRTKQILASLAELKPGDAMVHIDHGIGIYRGLQHLKTGAVEGRLPAAGVCGGDKLYLPMDRLGLVQRYVGGGEPPSLAKLGGPPGKRPAGQGQEGHRGAGRGAAGDLRQTPGCQGFSFSPPDEMFREFEASFAWEETPDQLSAIRTCWPTCSTPAPWTGWSAATWATARPKWPCGQPSRRCWTASRWRCWSPPPSWPSSISRPSSNRLKEYPVRVEALSRFRTPKEQKESWSG